MPNILLTNICNLRCDYCFAGDNLDTGLSSKTFEIPLSLYLLYLKHIILSGEKEVRLLGGEPLLHTRIYQILSLSYKAGFQILLFSNLSLPHEKIFSVFKRFPENFFPFLRININLNTKSFYKITELNEIQENASYLFSKGAKIIVSTILRPETDFEFIFSFAKIVNAVELQLKPFNGNKLNIDTSDRNYGKMIMKLISQYGKIYNITFACGLSKNIFTSDEKRILKYEYNISPRYGCFGNGGKYDIDIDGNIFRCFPLQKFYSGVNLKTHYSFERDDIIRLLEKKYYTGKNDGHCLGSNKNVST